MNSIIKKTFGGLTLAYYFRQLFFGACLAGLLLVVISNDPSVASIGFSTLVGMIVVNTLLYPYARFVYDSIASFIMGDTIIFLPLVFAMIWKFLWIMVLWTVAIFIAPIGLLFLFFYHSRS